MEQSVITLNLGRFTRGLKARHQQRIAFANAPLPSRWRQLGYRDFKQARIKLLGHPRNMQSDSQNSRPEHDAF